MKTILDLIALTLIWIAIEYKRKPLIQLWTKDWWVLLLITAIAYALISCEVL